MTRRLSNDNMTVENGHLGLLEKPVEPRASIRDIVRNMTPQFVYHAILELLRPEFLSRRKTAPTVRKGNTAWLDGLRGAAAFGVCIMHLTVYTHHDLERCYGAQLGFMEDKGKNYSILALPVIRLPFLSGHFAVMLFFIISGYVLPRRMVSLIHQGRREEFLEAANSAMFRRPMRLLLPVVWSTLILAIIWHFPFEIKTAFPTHQSSLFAELRSWAWESSMFVYFFKNGLLWTYYNAHSWTIPVELRGSMLIFVWLFATHQASIRTRVWANVGMIFYLAFGTPGAWYAGFFSGLLLSETELLSHESDAPWFPWVTAVEYFRAKPLTRQVLLHVFLGIGTYLASQPSSDWGSREQTLGNCPGWITLSKMIPQVYETEGSNHRWFWLFWAAWIVVYCIREIAWIRSIFETNFAQYLGRHSFALYLVHGPIIGLFSDRLFYLTGFRGPKPLMDDPYEPFLALYNKWHDSAWWPIPDGGPQGLEYNFVIVVLLSLPVMLYCAEVGTRVFDEPSVKLSSWAYKKWKRS
ncbi:hypothetical protein B0A48_08301 [Cryoendolithus antarcticus]|uniref:Acyltransferase 3 domain-containing protein n=1 Tax=Cryoendolithus antarcticus TaxID=1507870 RepID=A0A1V8T5L1_9PEZI|nr:hypothetical protein B0A48_08301 [Cryoendolithus antarcticus]